MPLLSCNRQLALVALAHYLSEQNLFKPGLRDQHQRVQRVGDERFIDCLL